MHTKQLGLSLAAGGAGLLLLLQTSSADAAFGYLSCSKDAKFPDFMTLKSGPHEFERDTRNAAYYANWAHLTWDVYFNPNVGLFSPRIWDVVTEWPYDYLKIFSQYNSNTLSGSNIDGFNAGAYFLNQGKFSYTWHTDVNVNMASTPRINGAEFACLPTNAPLTSIPLNANTRVEGILLGTGDTHFWAVNVGGGRVTINVDILAANPPVNLDVYVSKSGRQFPDDGAGHYDYAGVHGSVPTVMESGGEILHMPSGFAGTRYIAVHSKTGNANYALQVSEWNTSFPVQWKVCAEGGLSVSNPQWSNYRKFAQNLSARVAQFTNGGLWMQEFVTQNVSGCGSDPYCKTYTGKCDFVMSLSNCAGGQTSGGRVRLPHLNCAGAYGNPAGLGSVTAHEVGHAVFGLPDEYQSIGPWAQGNRGPWCGHTIMNGPDQSHTICTDINHCSDPANNFAGTPYVPPNGNCGASGWTRLLNTGKFVNSALPNFSWSANQWDSLRSNTVYLDSVFVYPS